MLVFFLLLLLLGAGAAVADAVYRTAAVVVAAGPPCRQVKSKLAMSSSCSAVRATQPSFHPFIHADRQLTSQPASQTANQPADKVPPSPPPPSFFIRRHRLLLHRRRRKRKFRNGALYSIARLPPEFRSKTKKRTHSLAFVVGEREKENEKEHGVAQNLVFSLLFFSLQPYSLSLPTRCDDKMRECECECVTKSFAGDDYPNKSLVDEAD